MTFKEFMAENGYELQTTFWSDFSIADRFGLSAIRDTFDRAFEEWKENYKYLRSWYWCSITKSGNTTRQDGTLRPCITSFGKRPANTRWKT